MGHQRYSQYDSARQALASSSGNDELPPKVLFATDFGCDHFFELSPFLQNGHFYNASWLATRDGMVKSEDGTKSLQNKRLPPTLGLLYPHVRSEHDRENQGSPLY